jgi:predicted metal-dependent hydrolase
VRKDARHAQSDPARAVDCEPIGVEDFKRNVCAWAERLEVAPKEVRITGMRRKWASCSRQGRLTFDRGLLRQPEALRTEAIVHELVHLKVPNHGPLFRALLGAALHASNTES